jgi:hypothetical protein
VAADGETVAVKTTSRPLFDGLGLDVSVVVVATVFRSRERRHALPLPVAAVAR